MFKELFQILGLCKYCSQIWFDKFQETSFMQASRCMFAKPSFQRFHFQRFLVVWNHISHLAANNGQFCTTHPIFYLLGFCWDDHSRPQMCWDRSQRLPSQTPTIHPSQFIWLNSVSVPKTNVASLQRYFVGMPIQTMIAHWKSESVV